MNQKKKKKQSVVGLPLCGAKTRARLWLLFFLFQKLSDGTERIPGAWYLLLDTALTHRRHRVLASQSTSRYNAKRGDCSTAQGVVGGKLEGRIIRGLCLELSLRA